MLIKNQSNAPYFDYPHVMHAIHSHGKGADVGRICIMLNTDTETREMN